MRALLGGALVTVACLAAAPAQAATEFTFGQGRYPDLAVDGSGTAHLAWVRSMAGSEDVLYCPVPRGTRACSNTQVLFGEEPQLFGIPHVLLAAPGQVLVLQSQACDAAQICTFVRRSTDGGVSFGPAERIVDTDSAGTYATENAVLGPGNSVSFLSLGGSTLTYVNAPLGGGTATETASLTPGQSPGLVGLHGSTPVVVYEQSDARWWRAYDGSGDPNFEANWTPARMLDSSAGAFGRGALAGGPDGLFVLYARRVDGAGQWVVRKFTGTGWTAPVALTDSGFDNVEGDLHQDASGGLHFVVRDKGPSPDELIWRASGDGLSWSPPTTVNRSDDIAPRLNVAAAADGQGFVSWDSGQPGSVLHDLRAIPLEPLPGGDPCKPPSCWPAGGKDTGSVGNRRLVEKVVVSDCATRRVTLRVRIKRRQVRGRWRIRVRKVVFRLDRQRRKVDRRPPYRVRYSLRQHGLPNSKHTARAAVHLRMRKGSGRPRSRKIALVKKFRLCPLG